MWHTKNLFENFLAIKRWSQRNMTIVQLLRSSCRETYNLQNLFLMSEKFMKDNSSRNEEWRILSLK